VGPRAGLDTMTETNPIISPASHPCHSLVSVLTEPEPLSSILELIEQVVGLHKWDINVPQGPYSTELHRKLNIPV